MKNSTNNRMDVMKIKLFAISLLSCAALTHANYQIAAEIPDPRNPIQSRILHTGSIPSVAFSPDGSKLATGSWDDTARIWDTFTGTLLHTLTGHTNYVTSVAFSPDGSKLATGSWDDTACIWDTLTGTLLLTLTGHTNPINSVAFSPDGSKLATGSDDHKARIWDVHSGTLLNTLIGHTDHITSIAFSPDGSKLVTGSWDDTACIWNTLTGTSLHTLTGHTRSVDSVAFSPDGSKLVTGSMDNTTRIWDTLTGTSLHALTDHTHSVTSVAFSPDGSKIAIGSDDRTVHIWYDTRTENKMRGAALALLSAMHDRLGENSPAHGCLNPYLIRDIVMLARPDSFGPIDQEEHHVQAEEPAPDAHQPTQPERQGLTRYLPAVTIAVPGIAAAAWLLHHFMHR